MIFYLIIYLLVKFYTCSCYILIYIYIYKDINI